MKSDTSHLAFHFKVKNSFLKSAKLDATKSKIPLTSSMMRTRPRANHRVISAQHVKWLKTLGLHEMQRKGEQVDDPSVLLPSPQVLSRRFLKIFPGNTVKGPTLLTDIVDSNGYGFKSSIFHILAM